jgi:hypothetical protein
MKHNKLSKYSKTLTPEEPSEDSTPQRKTYNQHNKEAPNMTTAAYTLYPRVHRPEREIVPNKIQRTYTCNKI